VSRLLKAGILMIALWGVGAGVAVSAEPNLNPDLGGPEYAPFTLFSPDSAGRETDKDKVILVFHGFASAVPNGTYKRIRKRMLDGWTTIGVNYDPLKPLETAVFLRTVVAERVRGRTLAVVGSSHGGWWAAWAAANLAADKAVRINPITDPTRQLAKYIGTQKVNKRRGITFLTQADDLVPYGDLGGAEGQAETLVILARDDEMIDHALTRKAIEGKPNHETVIFDAGGHTINLKKHPALDLIAQFLDR